MQYIHSVIHMYLNHYLGLFWSVSIPSMCKFMGNISGLVQERRNSIANAMELLLSCTNPSLYACKWWGLSHCSPCGCWIPQLCHLQKCQDLVWVFEHFCRTTLKKINTLKTAVDSHYVTIGNIILFTLKQKGSHGDWFVVANWTWGCNDEPQV